MADRAQSCLFGDPLMTHPAAGSDTGPSLVSGASRASLTMAATHLFREAIDVPRKRAPDRIMVSAGPRSIADDHGFTKASLGFITESGTGGSAS